MSTSTHPKELSPTNTKKTFAVAGGVAAAVGLVSGSWVAGFVILCALLGAPLFAVMGGASVVAWLRHADITFHHVRFVAPRVLDDHFAGSPILVTIPLFTFLGYVLARAKTAERLVRFATALLGWLPGGLAIVCVVTSAVFTLLTGGSGVTIIAIGGLLLPALKKQGYSDKFALGLLTSGGSLGLLLPLSLPLLIYALVGHVDEKVASQAVIVPGMLVLLLFVLYSVYIGIKENVPRTRFSVGELLSSLNELKWELMIPVILGVSIAVLGRPIDESAGLVAFYTLIVETFVYKDISLRRDGLPVVKASMAMAGAVILILTMANALVNYVVQEKIPDQVLNAMLNMGLDKPWQFLLGMNVFLLVLGMLMEGFSAIFVAVPLLMPFAARFHLSPFHVGMIFLINLELAYCMPPLGLNLFIAGFRFNVPPTRLYRPILPFLGLLTAALLMVSYIPSISTVAVNGKIAAERKKALDRGEAPRESWLLECVQYDPTNPLPCTDADRLAYPDGKLPVKEEKAPEEVAPTPGAETDDELMKEMQSDGPAKPSDKPAAPKVDDDDALMKEMMEK